MPVYVYVMLRRKAESSRSQILQECVAETESGSQTKLVFSCFVGLKNAEKIWCQNVLQVCV